MSSKPAVVLLVEDDAHVRSELVTNSEQIAEIDLKAEPAPVLTITEHDRALSLLVAGS
jgi:hypothetical protein